MGFGYDAIGNIICKTDLGTCAGSPAANYTYPASGASSVRPHAVTSIAGTVNNGVGVSSPSYSYDANGNMTSGGGRTIAYTAFNVPNSITTGGSNTLTFNYDSEHQRYKQIAPEGTTYYINAGGVSVELFMPAGGGTGIWRNYFAAWGEVKGMQVQTSTSGTYMYFHRDHLGSVVAMTDVWDNVTERDGYDTWGKRRAASGAADPYDTQTSATIHGYTDQEHLSDVALIHMNARVYDPQIGKFTSTDPLVGQPYSTQGWNRYAYVRGNPLNSTDPSGMDPPEEIVITAPSTDTNSSPGGVDAGGTSSFYANSGGASDGYLPPRPLSAQQVQEIVVTAQRKKTTSAQLQITAILVEAALSGGDPGGPQSTQASPQPLAPQREQITITATPRVQCPPCNDGRIYDPTSPYLENAVALGLSEVGAFKVLFRVLKFLKGTQNTVTGTNKQFGQKFGQHGADLGIDNIDGYKDLANSIYNNPNSIVTHFSEDSPIYPGETHYSLDGKLLRLDQNGNFRSLY